MLHNRFRAEGNKTCSEEILEVLEERLFLREQVDLVERHNLKQVSLVETQSLKQMVQVHLEEPHSEEQLKLKVPLCLEVVHLQQDHFSGQEVTLLTAQQVLVQTRS